MSVWPPPPLHPSRFAIIPRIWSHCRTWPNTSAPNQGQAPFWFHTNARMLIGGHKKNQKNQKNQNGWQTTAPCSKWRTITPFITTPSVRKPATEMHTWHVLCSLQNLLTPLSPLSLFNPSPKRKKVGSLPLVLFNDCFVVQDVQEISAFVT